MKKRRFFAAVLAAVIILSGVGCSKENNGHNEPP